MSVASIIAVAIGALLDVGPQRIVQVISRMRMTIVPLIALTFLVDCLRICKPIDRRSPDLGRCDYRLTFTACP